MERSSEPLSSALATLRTRWGSAAVRLGNGNPVGSVASAGREAPAVHGALALAPFPDSDPGAARPTPVLPVATAAPPAGTISTGFPALDTVLGTSGLPVEASVVVRGGPSSGKTTLALRSAAEAQASGDIVAWLDLSRAFDPVEAVGRGVDLRWLLVIRPQDTPEGLALAGALLAGRAIGLLVVDLPARSRLRLDDQLRRLVAHARRVGARLIVLEPPSVMAPVQAALAQAAGLRLELARRAWLRLGRDVVGQRTAVTVAKNRYGPPGRSVDLDIHYLGEGERMLAAHRLASDGAEATAEVSQPVSPAVLPSVGVSAPVRPTPRLVVA